MGTAAGADLIEALAGEILHNYARGRLIVAIDGVDGAAADLRRRPGRVLEKRGHSAFRRGSTSSSSPRERRKGGLDSPEVRYRNTYDYSVLRRVLIEPFKIGGTTAFVAEAFDQAREQQIQPKWLTAPEDAILVCRGVFLHRPELRGVELHDLAGGGPARTPSRTTNWPPRRAELYEGREGARVGVGDRRQHGSRAAEADLRGQLLAAVERHSAASLPGPGTPARASWRTPSRRRRTRAGSRR